MDFCRKAQFHPQASLKPQRLERDACFAEVKHFCECWDADSSMVKIATEFVHLDPTDQSMADFRTKLRQTEKYMKKIEKAKVAKKKKEEKKRKEKKGEKEERRRNEKEEGLGSKDSKSQTTKFKPELLQTGFSHQ